MTKLLRPDIGPDTTTPLAYDLAVFFGRFQPFHRGHLFVVEEALKHARHVVLVIGSAGAPRDVYNPFTYIERADMIRLSIDPKHRERIRTRPLEDTLYNDDQWVVDAQKQVNQVIADIEVERASAREPGDKAAAPRKARVALIGHEKDHTSYYLKLFPQWAEIGVPNWRNLSATQIREAYFSNIGPQWLVNCDGHKVGDLPQDHLVSSAVKSFLTEFAKTASYDEIKEEVQFNDRYRAQWASSPHPVTFVTVDACVVQSGHVLLVRRRDRPGKGRWALPGGFLGQTETIEQGMLRELREETKISLPPKVLKGSIAAQRVFDHPQRSARGRTITHGFLIHLRPEQNLPGVRRRHVDSDLPAVEGADDAETARWWPIADVRRDMMFEDHYSIIQTLLGLIPQ